MIIVPWTLWFIFHKKESRARLLFAGFATMLIASFLDFLGVAYGLWVYLVDVIFTIPAFIVWDFSVLPVIVMFFLQIKPAFNPIIKGIIFGAFSSFVGEPVTVWLGLYDPLEWKYIYSFPIYILIYLIIHYISRSRTFGPLE
ncbi:CBO0543 family protein [Halalkalibacter wakoensis]|uniref:CBO0543 family protein n=1 Tax=Halalkalibacter wakoensis TaxID=127891 RepID=UPI00068F3230|nr:CBO0543 family protein [Halalkalibacter wakoensis]